MEIGDIVFIKGARKKSTQIVWGQFLYFLWFKLINICNNKKILHGEYSHIAMYIGHGTFIEAYPNKKNGVRFTKFGDIFNPQRTVATWRVYRNAEFKNQSAQIIKNCESFLEKKFEMHYKKGTKETYFCSKLIYSILKDIKYFNIPDVDDAHKVYPDHFYTLIKKNADKLWVDVTTQYQVNTIEKKFLMLTSHHYMRNKYNKILKTIYKDRPTYVDIRFHELTDGTLSNFTYLSEKIADGSATEEEKYEFYLIKDEDIEYSCITKIFNVVSCVRSNHA